MATGLLTIGGARDSGVGMGRMQAAMRLCGAVQRLLVLPAVVVGTETAFGLQRKSERERRGHIMDGTLIMYMGYIRAGTCDHQTMSAVCWRNLVATTAAKI